MSDHEWNAWAARQQPDVFKHDEGRAASGYADAERSSEVMRTANGQLLSEANAANKELVERRQGDGGAVLANAGEMRKALADARGEVRNRKEERAECLQRGSNNFASSERMPRLRGREREGVTRM